MDPSTIVAIAFCILAFGLVSRRIEGSPITAPMVFTAIGVLAGPTGAGVIDLDLEGGGAHGIIEFTLILVLFTDASRIPLRALRRGLSLPVRLLLIGMPLTIGLGLLVALGLFPQLAVAEAALLAAILAPTDAALGQVVVSSTRVPLRIRQALNVESGLNDGIAVPVVVALIAAAAVGAIDSAGPGATEAATAAGESGSVVLFALKQIGFGPLVGFGVGCAGGWLVERAVGAGTMGTRHVRLAGVALALGAFAGAELLGGNGFIAAFAAGIAVGNTTTEVCGKLQDFAEDEGQLLAILAFVVFGATMVPEAVRAIDLPMGLYVAASLTVVRMVPVAIALMGSGLRLPSVAFLGWFGPRGLATILFALVVLEQQRIPSHSQLFHLASLTVLASTVLHGLTAAPLASRYGAWAARSGAGAERVDVPDLPVRIPLSRPPSTFESTETLP